MEHPRHQFAEFIHETTAMLPKREEVDRRVPSRECRNARSKPSPLQPSRVRAKSHLLHVNQLPRYAVEACSRLTWRDSRTFSLIWSTQCWHDQRCALAGVHVSFQVENVQGSLEPLLDGVCQSERWLTKLYDLDAAEITGITTRVLNPACNGSLLRSQSLRHGEVADGSAKLVHFMELVVSVAGPYVDVLDGNAARRKKRLEAELLFQDLQVMLAAHFSRWESVLPTVSYRANAPV